MTRASTIAFVLFSCFVLPALSVLGQEQVGPVLWNPLMQHQQNYTRHQHSAARTTSTSLSLPFFDDFTGYDIFPDSSKWTDFEVFINNTMCVSPLSRGCATFDALSNLGVPYDSFSNTDSRYADSLTSKPINLLGHVPGDSVYLSFFYQPQGNGFYPSLLSDSLMLYFKNQYGDFEKVWSTPGFVMLQPFQEVVIPLTDTLYFHSTFQFRFVNIASVQWADAVWNLDYVKLDANRSFLDTTVNDVAITSNPTFLLNDYTSMPYSQFMANPSGEIAGQITDSIRNDSSLNQTINYHCEVRDVASGALLTAHGPTAVPIPAYQIAQASEPLSIAYPTYPNGTPVVFETKYFIEDNTATGPTVNDTIVKDQVFDNYLAYDDGSAEKSYYLNLFSDLPGEIQVEYHLNHPDTLRGMSIFFGRQIPFSSSKLFAIYIYSSLAGINGAYTDVRIDSTDLLTPAYADSTNHFWTYTLDQPLLLPAGTFYAGILQPAESGSDSLYIGLDVNRIGGNHVYFRVLYNWEPSLISGALMMRPLLGHYVTGTSVNELSPSAMEWQVTPNPAKDKLKISFDGNSQQATYNITNIQGQAVMHGKVSDKSIDIAGLAPGMYFINLAGEGVTARPKKFVKE